MTKIEIAEIPESMIPELFRHVDDAEITCPALRWIRKVDDEWSRKVQAHETPFDPNIVRMIDSMYRWWRAHVPNANAKDHALAWQLTMDDVDFLIRAHAQIERGEYASLDEV